MPQLPVILLSFANDRLAPKKYLPNLAAEVRELRRVLLEAKANELCEFVILENASAEDIFSIFLHPLYRDRVAIFHFSGHANSFELLLEDVKGRPQIADGQNLAAFLGQQRGLQLVFLNGCASQGHGVELLNNNVANVIVTSTSVADKQAKQFSCLFYTSIAGGGSIARAYHEASSAQQTVGGKSRGIGLQTQYLDRDQIAWQLLTRPGAEVSGNWSLPKAVANPLFGIPAPPALPLPVDPFPNLHWYTAAHADVFFGRGYEIRTLYTQLTDLSAPALVLLHGQSGVGKSSLLEAGLIPRLIQEQEIRSERLDPDEGLAKNLKNVFDTSDPEEVRQVWCRREVQQGQPFTLILDQLEEIFMHSETAREISLLSDFLRGVFGNSNQIPIGRVLLSLRKEYLAELIALIQVCQLPYTDVFVRSLDEKGIIEAVSGIHANPSLQRHYRLNIAPELPGTIAHDLLRGTGKGSIAPTLQILLHKLWEEARRSDPEDPVFSMGLYRKLKTEGLWLDDFLDRQLAKLPPQFQESGLSLDLLKFHITDLDTARQRSPAEIESTYEHVLPEVKWLIRQFIDTYLLLDIKGETRLAHDTLAPLLSRRYNESDASGQRARRLLESKELNYRQDQDQPLLTAADLVIIDAGKSGMRQLKPQERFLITHSRKYVRQQLIRKRILSGALVTLLLVALVLGWLSLNRSRQLLESEAARLLDSLDYERQLSQTNRSLSDLQREYQLSLSGLLEVQTLRDSLVRDNRLFLALARENEQKFAATAQALEAFNLANLDEPDLWGAFEKARKAYRTDPNFQTTRTIVDLYQKVPFKKEMEGRLTRTSEKCVVRKEEYGRSIALEVGSQVSWQDLVLPPGTSLDIDLSRKTDISPDGRYAFTVLRKQEAGSQQSRGIYIWRNGDDLPIRSIEIPPTVTDVFFSRSGKAIITNDLRGTREVWYLWEQALFRYNGTVNDIKYAPAGEVFAVATEEGKLHIWSVEGHLMKTLEHRTAVNTVHFLGANTLLLVATDDPGAYQWKLSPWETQKTVIGEAGSGGQPIVAAVPVGGDIKGVLIARRYGGARVYSKDNRPVSVPIGGEHRDLRLADVSSEGNKILTVHDPTGSDGLETLKLWDVKGEAIASVLSLATHINTAVFSPGGRDILLACSDNFAYLFHYDGQSEALSLKAKMPHSAPVNSAAFSSDGNYIITASSDHSAKIWSRSGLELFRIPHQEIIISAEFSPNAGSILLCDIDGTCWQTLIDPELIINKFEQTQKDL